MRLHLGRAFAVGATGAEVLEALSTLIMACSVATLTDAAREWSAAAWDGQCPPPYDDEVVGMGSRLESCEYSISKT